MCTLVEIKKICNLFENCNTPGPVYIARWKKYKIRPHIKLKYTIFANIYLKF